MKKLTFSLVAGLCLFAFSGLVFAEINYVKSYSRKDGTSVSGHYRDTSGDGNSYNNANYLGYND